MKTTVLLLTILGFSAPAAKQDPELLWKARSLQAKDRIASISKKPKQTEEDRCNLILEKAFADLTTESEGDITDEIITFQSGSSTLQVVFVFYKKFGDDDFPSQAVVRLVIGKGTQFSVSSSKFSSSNRKSIMVDGCLFQYENDPLKLKYVSPPSK